MSFVVCISVLLLLLFQAPLVPGLTIHSIYPRYGSLAGGTTVSVYGSGFTTDMYNSVNLVYLGTIPCDVIAYTANSDRLECETRPYPGGEEGSSYPRLQSSVHVDGDTHLSTGSNDAFYYHWSYTPQIWKISPNSGPVGALIEVGGNRFQWSHNLYTEFTLGTQVCELRDSQGDNAFYNVRSKWPLIYMTCLTTEVVAGGWNASATISGSRGHSWSHSQALYPVHDWSLAMYELFPDIHSVSPQRGSPSGGALITIRGTGFSAEQDQLEVDIDGTPCQVVRHTSTQIQCWSGSPHPDSHSIADSSNNYPITLDGYRFKGSRGVRVEQYRSISGNSVDNLHSSSKYPDNPDRIFSFPSFSTEDNSRRGNYGERLSAFFKPHSSGRHSFFTSNDDGARVWLGTGNNLTTAYYNQIVDSTSATGFENYARFERQRSDVQSLDQDEDYLLIGEFKEGSGLDYLTVAALLHDDVTYNYKQTGRAIHEEQRVVISSAGLYDIQSVSVTVNTSAASDDASVVLSWGGRETEPVAIEDMQEDADTLGAAVLDLFAGVCEFDISHGINHFPADNGFDFEDGVHSSETWGSWNGVEPFITEEEALCGRHSLYVPDGRTLASGLSSSNPQKTSDYPFLCLGYKVPHGQHIAVAVNVKGYGWYSIPLSGQGTQTPYTILSDFFDEEYSSKSFHDDDNWHYACTDLQFLLVDKIPLEDDQNPPRFHEILELGLYSDPNPGDRGFFIDEFSLSSESRELFTDDRYVAPVRPNGRSLHTVLATGHSSLVGDDLVTVTVSLELVPSDCFDDLPLISIDRTEGEGVVSSSIARIQTASPPLEGFYSLSFNGESTSQLPHHASQEEIKLALEELSGVGEVTVSLDQEPLSHDLLGRFCPGRSFSVRFDSSPGDLPSLEANTTLLTGDEVSVTATEIVTGGLFMAPIPGHMLQTVETTPQVHVRVRGQLAACSGGIPLFEETTAEEHYDHCGFTYTHTISPMVTMVTPASAGEGDTITITGSGFSNDPEDVLVTFGSIGCKAISSTSVQISCTLDSGFGGYHQLYLHIVSTGVADTSNFGISYDVSVDSVDMSSGSQAGGTDILISGTGFYYSDYSLDSDSVASVFVEGFTADACPNGWENTVEIDGNACSIKESSSTTILCTTPAETGTAGTYDITVSVGCVGDLSLYSTDSFVSGFSYDAALTPSLGGISPSEGAVFGGEALTITGSGFGADITALSVKIGGEECEVSSVTDSQVVCSSPAHSPGSSAVELFVAAQGKAAGDVVFTYRAEVDTISHCTGSLFGGQVLTIDGTGFGSDMSLVSVTLGERSCDVNSLDSGQILCTTTSTAQTHLIDNNSEHPEYGLGYQWSPSSLVIQPGDRVTWSWTGSSFTARRGVAQVSSPGDLLYSGDGFRSHQAVTGTFSHTFTKPGVYYYITEGFAHIGFNGSITVAPLTDTPASLSFSLNNIAIEIDSPTCQQTGQPFTDYTYSADSTPQILSVSPSISSPGGVANFELFGLSTDSDHNVLTFGGSGLTCSIASPAVLSASSTPSSMTTIATYTDSVTLVECTLPSDIIPGNYRPVLHVAGRGWASASVEDTTITIQPRINSPPSVAGVSLRGGIPISFFTTGLLPQHITSTRVLVGNTPCVVQNIASDGQLTCLTQSAVDDGFSSIINRNSPVGYWTLQADLPFGEFDGVTGFRNTGSVGDSGDADIFGLVMTAINGISGNSVTDQAAHFDSSYLSVPSSEQFTRPAGFGAEFWAKSDQTTSSYRMIFSSVNANDDGLNSGYVVLINPCDQIEFWLATGDVETESSASGSGGLQTIECDVISDVSQCVTGPCIGRLDARATDTLPRGVWNIIRSEQINLTTWSHVYFNWFVNSSRAELFSSWAESDCSRGDLCSGEQSLSTNGCIQRSQTTFVRELNADIEIGGTSILTEGNTNTVGELTPFAGYLDEVAFYTQALSEAEIQSRVDYGTTEEQPVWVSVEGLNGVGTGSVPTVDYPEWDSEFSDEMVLDWDSLRNEVYTLDSDTALRFEWNGLRSIREVTHSVYESCDLEAPAVREWAWPSSGGVRTVWLEEGRTHYFIDSVVGGCQEGRRITARVGDVRTVEWRVGSYSDITVTRGTGLLFQWDDGVMHDVIEMSVPLETAQDCSKGDPNTRDSIGLVVKEWLGVPSVFGEVAVNELSVGDHYFMCSVEPHCSLGMRLTVHIVEDPNSIETEATQQTGPVVHTIPWRIQDYADLTIVYGESVQFSWEGFHSLHQVRQEVYESCQASISPLFEWGLPSVDTSVTIDNLSPGDYYFLCAVAGHCDAGMKIKVTVLPDDGLPVLDNSVAAVCADGVTCSLAYSVDDTPTLTTVEPAETVGGSTLTLTGSNLLAPSVTANSALSDVTVLVDKAPCNNIMALTAGIDADHMISCDLADYESGYYHVDLIVSGRGYASVTPGITPGSLRDPDISPGPSSPYPQVFISSVTNNISPNTGSINGGTVVTITGSGFSSNADRNSVYLGSNQCILTASSTDELTCVTAAGSGTVDLIMTVNGYPVSTSLTFDYSTAATPSVDLITGGDSLSSGDTLQFEGVLLANDQSEVVVQVVGSADSTSGSECTILSFSAMGDVQTITCTVPSKPAGVYSLHVDVDGYGFASVPDSINYALEISSFSPTTAGLGGGMVLTIEGSGFPDELSGDVSIVLCDGELGSTNCVPTSTSNNEIQCRLEAASVASPFAFDTDCMIKVSVGGLAAVSTGVFSFIGAETPRIDSISPDLGGTGGGTVVTVDGAGFDSGSSETTSVTIDGTECEVTNVTNSTVTCVTGNHTTTLMGAVTVFVPTKGNALTLDGSIVTFEYVDLWSSQFTWGGGPLPVEGDSVYIKTGQTVFLDVNTPVLNLVLIEGSLIFQDEQDLHLQANYIFINTGRLQVGTEESPFTHQATITLHGKVTDPEIPIYGAKVLGIRQGELDLHGQPRQVTWTRLRSSALSNDTTLEVQDSVDWRGGDRIVIAPTGKDGNETEEAEVVSVSADGHVISLLSPLKYLHHGITDYYEGGHSIEIRAEVGLLSHNVVVQGSRPPPSEDEDAIDPQYGSQIFIHRTGSHPTPIRIEHTEIRYGGQAFRLGRYAVHFHLSGTMAGSYVRNCAIHHSNNRAITAHGVHDLLIEGNVAYDIKGHTYFVEDGIETNNHYLRNLGILTRGSSSLLNTDQIPATFWITNPQNTFIGNAAAASRAYGFWFDFDAFPSGASRTGQVCPNKEPFGVFHGNTAHTCNEFGLRIWETYVPYADGCGATEPQEANLTDFTTYANGINGVELSVVGHVRLIGFKVADNVQNGIEIIETLGHWGGPLVHDTLVISHSSANNGAPQTGGIKTPNTPRLTISNVTFVNFDSPSTSCLKACSHCKVRQGGFQVWFQDLNFIGGSANHKAAFQWEFEVLYKDLDGTLTGLPGGGWVMPDSPLTPPSYCTPSVSEFSINKTVINGTVCSSDINFLRMAWNRAEPLETLEDVPVLVGNEFGNSSIPWRHYRLTHLDGYMFTMPDGYQHTLVWDTPIEHNVDTTSYNAGVYGVRTDSRLWVTHSFVQEPDHISVGGNHDPVDYRNIPDQSDTLFSWFLDNSTDPTRATYLISGANLTDNQNNNITYHYSYEPCPRDGCPPPQIDYGPYEDFQRLWSNPEHWPSGEVPQEGEDVIISSRWRMLMDVVPPTLGKMYVLGELMVEDERDYNITADLILIQGEMARMIIGTEEERFSHRVVITLRGLRDDEPLTLSRRLTFGSKGIGVFGNLSIHGEARTSWTRLASSVSAGSDTITVEDTVDWREGDEIVIAPSGWEPEESEIRTVTDYHRSSGTVTLDQALDYDHTIHSFLDSSDSPDPPYEGSSPWWGDGGSLAPEVGLLTHNIIIQGGEDPTEPLETHHYGCRILVGEYLTGSLIFNGRLKLDSVEIRHCGQGGYFSPRDPRYAIAFASSFETSEGSYIKRCSLHHGYNTAIGVHSSYGIEISDNVVWRTVDSAYKVGGRNNMVLDNLGILISTIQPNSPRDNHAVDFPAVFDIDGNNIVRGNAAAGSSRIGFRYAGDLCQEDGSSPTYDDAMFWDNSAHCGLIGLVVLGLPNDCTAVGGFTATHQWNYGIFSSTASSLIVTHVKIATGKVGLNLNVFGPNPVAHLLGNKYITVSDSLIVGSLPSGSCDTVSPSFLPRSISFTPRDHQIGVMMSSFNQKRSKMDGTGAWHLMKGYPVIDGVVYLNKVSFARFFDASCNYKTVAIANNPLSPDAVHPIHMTGTNKLNTGLENLAFFYEPKLEWIVQEDCIDMDCDGLKHALIHDNDGRFVSTLPTLGSIIPFAELRFANYSHRLPVTWLGQGREDETLAAPADVLQYMGIARGQTGDLDHAAGGCVWMESWGGYRCAGLQHTMLVIESLDEDTETRRLSPLALNGGDTGAGHYTDLINGPMDHGWCTYYTCLKRLSTFFTVVAMGSDYCVWMTGSPPTQIRFHLLNAGPDDAISMCIFFKDTRRKDVYKNNIFIEPENVRYLDGGGVQQTDGQYIPTRDQFGGANYFDRESQILHMVVRGSDPVEIRTPPVVQVSLSLAVSLDDFFNVGELVKNLAFVLKIDPNRIRVVKIVSESSGVAGRRRRSLLTEFNTTTVTLEFGNPPAPNITTTPPPTVAMEIMMAGEVNDSVDIADHTATENTPNYTNPFNDDPPENIDSFADSFNLSVSDYIDSIESYEEVLEEIQEVNELAGEVVDLVLTGAIANITNATVTGLTVVPATPPPSPPPPVVPPDYANATTDEGDPVIIPVDEVVEVPTIPPTPDTSDNGTTDDEPIQFVIPSSMIVTMEPLSVTGHLVHVSVSVYDNNGDLVTNLGLVNPWTCQATLIHPLGSRDPNAPALGGVTRVPFVGGVAVFTRLSVDRPSSALRLRFQTIPSRFTAETSVTFQVIGHSDSSAQEHIGFALEGVTLGLPGDRDLLDHVSQGISVAIDADLSRIQNLTVVETSFGLWVEFVLLDRQETDPPDVLGLEDTISALTTSLNQGTLVVSVDGVLLSGAPGSFQFVTEPPPTLPSPVLDYALTVTLVAVAASLVLLVVLIAIVVFCTCLGTKGKNKNNVLDEEESDKKHLYPMNRRIQVTPLPPDDDSSSNGSRENVSQLFVSRSAKRNRSLTSEDDSFGGALTDETSLGYSESGVSTRAVDCWEAPPSHHHQPAGPRRFTPSGPTSLSSLVNNPSFRSAPKPSAPWAFPQSGKHSQQPNPHHPVNLFVAPHQSKIKKQPQGRMPAAPGWS